MGNYNSQYESYYNNLINRKKFNLIDSAQKKNKLFSIHWFLKRVTVDLSGVLILTILVLTCREIATPQTKYIYSFCKDTVNTNFDYTNLVNTLTKINVNDWQNKINSFMKITNE
jgi:hypothetical protein